MLVFSADSVGLKGDQELELVGADRRKLEGSENLDILRPFAL